MCSADITGLFWRHANSDQFAPHLKDFRYPREFIDYAVWAYHRFALSTADFEDLLSERAVVASREANHLRGEPVSPPGRGLYPA